MLKSSDSHHNGERAMPKTAKQFTKTKKTGETKMANKERTTIMIDRELLAEAQNTAARIGIPLAVAGSTSKFLRYLLQDFNAKNPKHPKKA